MPINELKLAKELIRKPSITPKDSGAINLQAKNQRLLGINSKVITFKFMFINFLIRVFGYYNKFYKLFLFI